HGALDRRLWPRDSAELYLLLGCLTDLTSAVVKELGYGQAAEDLLHSAWAYALVIDHKPLMAHLRLQLASVCFWAGQPQRARDFTADGLRYLPDGPGPRICTCSMPAQRPSWVTSTMLAARSPRRPTRGSVAPPMTSPSSVASSGCRGRLSTRSLARPWPNWMTRWTTRPASLTRPPADTPPGPMPGSSTGSAARRSPTLTAPRSGYAPGRWTEQW